MTIFKNFAAQEEDSSEDIEVDISGKLTPESEFKVHIYLASSMKKKFSFEKICDELKKYSHIGICFEFSGS